MVGITESVQAVVHHSGHRLAALVVHHLQGSVGLEFHGGVSTGGKLRHGMAHHIKGPRCRSAVRIDQGVGMLPGKVAPTGQPFGPLAPELLRVPGC